MTTEHDLKNASLEQGNDDFKFSIYEQKQKKYLTRKLQAVLVTAAEDEKDFTDVGQKLFNERILPSFEEILETEVDELNSLKELRVKIKQMCSRLLQRINDLRLPPLKLRVAYLTDAGPGVAVSNFEVKFSDIELG